MVPTGPGPLTFQWRKNGIEIPGATSSSLAFAQLSLAEIYISRMDMLGRDRGERAKAALALDSALDVFGDNGHWGLGALAAERLERLRVAA